MADALKFSMLILELINFIECDLSYNLPILLNVSMFGQSIVPWPSVLSDLIKVFNFIGFGD